VEDQIIYIYMLIIILKFTFSSREAQPQAHEQCLSYEGYIVYY